MLSHVIARNGSDVMVPGVDDILMYHIGMGSFVFEDYLLYLLTS